MAKNSNVETSIEGNITSPEEFKEAAKQWAQLVRNMAKNNASHFKEGKKKAYTYKTGIHKGKTERKLIKSISYIVKEEAGITDNIGFKFPLHGIFRAYGVGNGTPRHPAKKHAEFSYIKRTPSDWLDEPINKKTDDLANIAAQFYGDEAVINTWGAKIKK